MRRQMPWNDVVSFLVLLTTLQLLPSRLQHHVHSFCPTFPSPLEPPHTFSHVHHHERLSLIIPSGGRLRLLPSDLRLSTARMGMGSKETGPDGQVSDRDPPNITRTTADDVLALTVVSSYKQRYCCFVFGCFRCHPSFVEPTFVLGCRHAEPIEPGTTTASRLGNGRKVFQTTIAMEVQYSLTSRSEMIPNRPSAVAAPEEELWVCDRNSMDNPGISLGSSSPLQSSQTLL